MDLKGIVAVSGLGGLAVALGILFFRELIAKKIFPQLSQEHAYHLLRLMSLLVFGLAISGLIVYAVISIVEDDKNIPTPPATDPTTVAVTPVVSTTCRLSGTVVGSDNSPLAKVAVGFTTSEGWRFLAPTDATGRFEGSCELLRSLFPFELEVTMPADSCVRKSGSKLEAPGEFERLNLKVASTCTRKVDINLKDLSILKSGDLKVITTR